MEPIKVLQLNLNRSTNAAKELIDLSKKLNLDIAIIQEPPFINDYIPILSSYNLILPTSPDRPRAIITIFNSALKFEPIPTSSSDLCAIKIFSPQSVFIILSVYLPSNQDITDHLQKIQTIIDHNIDLPIIISGDFNSSHTLWNSNSNTHRGSLIFDLIYQSDLTILTTPNPSYQHNDGRNSFIDLTLYNSNASHLVHHFHQLPPQTYSDHTPQSFSINIQKPTLSTQHSTWKFNEHNFEWNIFTVNFDDDKITSLLNQIQGASSHNEIDNCVKIFTDIILDNAYKTIPIKNHLPKTISRNIYRNQEIRCLHNDTKRVKNKLHRTSNPFLRNIFLNKYLNLKNKLTSLISNQSEQEWKNFIQSEDESPNVWNNTYKFIRNKLKHKTLTTPILSNNRSVDEIKALASSLFPSDSSLSVSPLYTVRTNISFPLNKLVLLLKDLNSKKAPGPDHISNNMIKNLPMRMIIALHQIILKSLSYGYFPTSWRNSFTRIILKPNKSDLFSPSSYRPISLTSHISKIYEKIVNMYLVHYLEPNGLIHHSQHGFRNNKSSISALEKIISDLNNIKLKHKAIISIDFKGAFDNAPHSVIIQQLQKLACPYFLRSIISHYLHNRKVSILSDHHNITHLPMGRGCPQGGVLSPTLWNVIMNNLLTNLSDNYTCTAYADDLTILAAGNTESSLALQINNITHAVNTWATNNKIPINFQKSNVLPIASRSSPAIDHLINLNTVTNTKILGVTFTQNLKFDCHIQNKISQLYKYLNILKLHISHKYGLTHSRRLILYKNFLLPSLLYASEIWNNKINFKTKRMLNTFDNAILRNAINAYKSTPIDCIHLLTNSPSILDTINLKSDVHNLKQKLPPLFTTNPLIIPIHPISNTNSHFDLTLSTHTLTFNEYKLCHTVIQSSGFSLTTKYNNHTQTKEASYHNIYKTLSTYLSHEHNSPLNSILIVTNTKNLFDYKSTVSKISNKLINLIFDHHIKIFFKFSSSTPPPITNIPEKFSYNHTTQKIIDSLTNSKFHSLMDIIHDNCTKDPVKLLYEHNLISFPQTQATTSFLTGHGPTREYLHRIWKISPSPLCPLCSLPETYTHITLHCPRFFDITNTYIQQHSHILADTIIFLIKSNTFHTFCQHIHHHLRLHNRSLKFSHTPHSTLPQ